MRRVVAMITCLCITSPVLADPDPPPHPVDPLPPPDSDTPPPTPPVEAPPLTPAPPAASKFVPPAPNPALPIVTVSTMPVPIYARDPDTEPRTAAWIATGVTVAFGVAVELWWLHRDKFEATGQPAFTDPDCTTVAGQLDPKCYGSTTELQNRRRHYQRIWTWTEGGLMSAMGVSAFVAGYLWSRHYHPLHRVGFVPAANGGSVSIGGDF
jgi:hypothetical protein